MSKNRIVFFALVCIALIQYTACRKEPAANPDNGNGGDNTSIVEMTPYVINPPTRFPDPEPIPDDNKMYIERMQLGRILFYDTRLSRNGESCNSCHVQSKGFAVDGVSQFDNGLTSLPLVNLAWYKNFMWSGRIIGTLEDVMLAEITKRFDTDMDKINAIEEYRTMFRDYYGAEVITQDHLAKALAQFMRSIISRNTKFDRYLLGREQLSAIEERGRSIYFSERGDCFHCHTILLTTDNSFRVNGLDSIYTKEIDFGRYNVTRNIEDKGKFRTPNLRNVALKNNFMHDGRFTSLKEVIEFYSNDVKTVPNIDPLMLKPNRVGGDLLLEDYEIEALVAFLGTFTDHDMITDTAYSNPRR